LSSKFHLYILLFVYLLLSSSFHFIIKACKTAISFFLNNPQLTPREKELVKSIPDTEMTLVMLGKCKVLAPNIEQYKKIAKRAAKEASKEAASLKILDT
jgi:hypothetical protein